MVKRLDPISFSEAESFEIDATLYEANSIEPLDLTGASIDWVISEGAAPGGVVKLAALLGTGIEIITPTAGTIKIAVHPPDHPDVVFGTYFHQLRVVLMSGRTIIPFEGALLATKSNFPPGP